MKRHSYLRLPGISVKDPNFYDGADYGDRDRFAPPVNTQPMAPAVSPEGVNLGDEQPSPFNPAHPTEHGSPFRLGGTR
jgi:hypothetical protein